MGRVMRACNHVRTSVGSARRVKGREGWFHVAERCRICSAIRQIDYRSDDGCNLSRVGIPGSVVVGPYRPVVES